jgi:two-component system copper resistance phosphate regulon response regulator CusR
MRVLVIEDSSRLSQSYKKGLTEESYIVDLALNGIDGLHMAKSGEYDLVILDINLPGMDGFTLMKELRSARSDVPVMMVTARDGIQDRIKGLDSGADDYLVKPFSYGELLARIRALLRRPGSRAQKILKYADIELDPARGRVFRAGKPIALSAREFSLLRVFLSHPNELFSRAKLFESVWNMEYDGLSNVLDVYINYLRNKLEIHGEPKLIHTIRGRGYVFGDDRSI